MMSSFRLLLLLLKYYLERNINAFFFFFKPEQNTVEAVEPASNENLRLQFVLFSKLFIIMGIPWIGEFVHFEFHGEHGETVHCSMMTEVLQSVSGI